MIFNVPEPISDAPLHSFFSVGNYHVALEWAGASEITETWHPAMPPQMTPNMFKQYSREKTHFIEKLQQELRKNPQP